MASFWINVGYGTVLEIGNVEVLVELFQKLALLWT